MSVLVPGEYHTVYVFQNCFDLDVYSRSDLES